MERIASPIKRLMGYTVDLLIGTIPSAYFIATTLTSPNIYRQFDTVLMGISIVLPFSVIYTLFNAWLTSKFGGSIGKIIVKTKVVDEKGNKISFFRAIFRNYIGFMVSGSIAFLGFIWILVDKKEHRAWHDLVSGTYVVSAS